MDDSGIGSFRFRSFRILSIAAVIFGRLVTDSFGFSTSIPFPFTVSYRNPFFRIAGFFYRLQTTS